MQHEVYADLLFLINFSMDFLTLYLSVRLLHRKMRPLHMCCASIVGGIYSVISLFLPFKTLISIMLDMLICLFMCFMVFYSKKSTLKQLLNSAVTFILISTIIGGIMTVLFNLLNLLDIPLQNGGDNISSWLFLILAIISGIAALKSGSFFCKSQLQKTINADITLNGKSITLCGFSDSGNILHDPVSGKPVIIADIQAVFPILPDIIKKSVISGNIDIISHIPQQYINKIRIIPCCSISGNKLIIGIVPDSIVIHNKYGSNNVSALFAPVNIPSLPKGYNAIIPGELNI